jgi:sulfate/thiosulfate transport system permease protein
MTPRVVAAFQLSFSTSFFAALANIFLGTLMAWVLVRYQFPGRRLLDAIVDFPFALPTAVAGIALTAIYSPNGWLGAPFKALTGLKLAFTPLGIFIALVFIGLPFVVRTVQPVVVMNHARIEQIGTPTEVHDYPATPFVWEFLRGTTPRDLLTQRS